MPTTHPLQTYNIQLATLSTKFDHKYGKRLQMKILMSGNPNYGLAQAFAKIQTTSFVSRSNGFDLTQKEDQEQLAQLSLEYDCFINSSALNGFAQTTLLYKVWNTWADAKHSGRIINIGSTIDWSRKGRAWIYSVEKKALMDASQELGTIGVWGEEPKIRITYLSFGSLATEKVIQKHPDRKLIPIDQAASYIAYIVNTPTNVNVNILHVDPIQ